MFSPSRHPSLRLLRPTQAVALALLLTLSLCTVSPAPRAAAQAAPAAPHVSYPADQAAHPQNHNEWWYVVGHVRHGSHTYGYEVTIFKFLNVQPPGFSSAVSIYRTDVAITDETAGKFHQKVTYYFPQSAHLSSSSLDAHVGNASLVATGPDDMDLRASFSSMKIALHLHSSRPPMYVGGTGYLQLAGQFTYYYSLTHLNTIGTLTVAGKPFPVSGVSWLDHQWGDWSWAGGKGWTWMALQLNNGVQLSLFDVRGFGTRYQFASVLDRSGHTRTVFGVTITSSGTWHSPHTAGTYPSGWAVNIPALRARFRIVPAVKDQEVVAPNQPRGSYWEGSGRLTGTYGGKPVTGATYTELTGYARG